MDAWSGSDMLSSEMVQRGISRKDVFASLLSGDAIEEYPDDTPFPSALFLHWIGGKPLHVVAALDPVSQWIFVITTYRPDLDHFEPDLKTRRRS